VKFVAVFQEDKEPRWHRSALVALGGWSCQRCTHSRWMVLQITSSGWL